MLISSPLAVSLIVPYFLFPTNTQELLLYSLHTRFHCLHTNLLHCIVGFHKCTQQCTSQCFTLFVFGSESVVENHLNEAGYNSVLYIYIYFLFLFFCFLVYGGLTLLKNIHCVHLIPQCTAVAQCPNTIQGLKTPVMHSAACREQGVGYRMLLRTWEYFHVPDS